MNADRDCVVLIGMPGAGKSTVGVLLAKRTGRGFLDTDIVIQEAEGRTLQTIVDTDGQTALRTIEDRVIRGLEPRRQVVATGGSAIYSAAAIAHLRRFGLIVYLRAALATIRRRIGDPDNRGLALPHGHTLIDLYREREPLYAGEAELILDVDDCPQEDVVHAVARTLGA